jgi:TolB-like protein
MPLVQQQTKNINEAKTRKLRTKIMLWAFMIILGMFLLSTSSLWIANKIIKPNQIRVAILPIRFKSNDQAELASNLEGVIKDSIIKSEKLKLLSTSAINNYSDKPFPNLNIEYSIRWIVEGQIDNYSDTTKLTLSLVDARTALVVYSVISDNNSATETLVYMSQKFIQKIPNSNN